MSMRLINTLINISSIENHKNISDISDSILIGPALLQRQRMCILRTMQLISVMFDFRLDLFVPESSHIGGFSMCSSPSEYTQNGTFDLAVKHSDHPAAEWVHSKVASDNVQPMKLKPNFLIICADY